MTSGGMRAGAGRKPGSKDKKPRVSVKRAKRPSYGRVSLRHWATPEEHELMRDFLKKLRLTKQ